ncbi:MAG: PKD domain-containing protein, partial [Acidimicrobiia bacterium]|nr:PKD domain-containing protein [Acidimicrobiia bacterium]
MAWGRSAFALLAVCALLVSPVMTSVALAVPPVADPGGPYAGMAGEIITFDGSGSTDSDGTIVSYEWTFGDGGTGTGVSPTHIYATAGDWTVTLTVTDNDGAPDTDTTSAVISVP